MVDYYTDRHKRRMDFKDWYKNASDEDRYLYDMFVDYSDELFSDFRFKPDSIVGEYVTAESEDGEAIIEQPPDILDFFEAYVLESFTYTVKPFDDSTVGGVNFSDFTVRVANIDDKAAIIHELIHLYESVFESFPIFYHDILLLSLYNSLKVKIPDLNRRIVEHSHLIPGMQITLSGGEHDILFLLKSFDLDLKCGYKLGTVCGYGRDT